MDMNISAAITFLTGFLVTYFVTPILAKLLEKHDMVGIDIHKLEQPKIPAMCGISITIGLTAAVAISSMIAPAYAIKFVTFLAVTLLACLIGIVDDLKTLGPRIKPLLTALACIPIILSGSYNPYPLLPIIGSLRLTIVYPLLIPFAVAVPANAVNMMDVLNGAMAGTSAVTVFFILICAALFGRWEIVILCGGLLGSLIAFYKYNRYPARVFSGDSGSLAVGAAIGALAILGSLEVVSVIALMPQIMNGFYNLSSIGRLYEHREISQRPTKLLKDGRLSASDNSSSPLTLTRMILADGPMNEKDIVKAFLILSIFSGCLSLGTALLTGLNI